MVTGLLLWNKEAQLKQPISVHDHADMEHGFFLRVSSEMPIKARNDSSIVRPTEPPTISTDLASFNTSKPLMVPIMTTEQQPATLLLMSHRKPRRRNAFTLPPGLPYTIAWLSDLATELSLHKNMEHQHLLTMAHQWMVTIEREKLGIIKLEWVLQNLQKRNREVAVDVNAENSSNGSAENNFKESRETTAETTQNMVDLLYEAIYCKEEALESLCKSREAIMHVILSNKKLFKDLKKYRGPPRKSSNAKGVLANSSSGGGCGTTSKRKQLSLFDEIEKKNTATTTDSLMARQRRATGTSKRRYVQNNYATTNTAATGTSSQPSSSQKTFSSRREKDRDALKKLIAQESLSS